MMATLCVECGPNVRIDEDGCCRSCGNGAMGAWLDSIAVPGKNANEPPPSVETVESLRFVRNILAANVAALTEDVRKAEEKVAKMRIIVDKATSIGMRLADAECDFEAEETLKHFRKDVGL